MPLLILRWCAQRVPGGAGKYEPVGAFKGKGITARKIVWEIPPLK